MNEAVRELVKAMVEVLPVVFSIGVWSRTLYIHIAMTSSTYTHKIKTETERALSGVPLGLLMGAGGAPAGLGT